MTIVAESQEQTVPQKLKYPKAVFFIISNEFCERFSFYGMRTILSLYLQKQLRYAENTATVIFHVFLMFAYFFPLFGAIIADSWLGKFRTIFYLSIVYAAGQLLLALSATPPLGLPDREMTILGLFLIAIGTGGIKPCVSAFGGDQFVLPQQEKQLITFFSLFYLSINSGSLIATFVTPILRNDVQCFGLTSCFSLAFLVPAILMSVSIVIFVGGKPLYKIKKPQGNVVLDVSKCVTYAISNKAKSGGIKKDHWLDHAEDKYDAKLIGDIKATFRVLKMFLPLPIFWALFDQQGSRWTFQATRMDSNIAGWTLTPDQMQVLNPLFIVIFIPIFESVIYPIFNKFGIFNTPLKKLTLGGTLAALSFVISALVEFQLEKTYAVLPTTGEAQLRIFNPLPCDMAVNLDEQTFVLESLSVWENKHVGTSSGSATLNFKADVSDCVAKGLTSGSKSIERTLFLNDAEAISYVTLLDQDFHRYVDDPEKSDSTKPIIRGLIYVPQKENRNAAFVLFGDSTLELNVSSKFNDTGLKEIPPGSYDILLDNRSALKGVELKVGGVYTIVGYSSNAGTSSAAVLTITEPNSLHIMWLVPQYVVITMGEIMFSVTGLEFAFSQAPVSMKSLLQAGWLLAVAFGNLIVVIIAEAKLFDRQVFEFLLFAGLMFLDMIVFAVMAYFYKYVENFDNSENTNEHGTPLEEPKKGMVNSTFTNDS